MTKPTTTSRLIERTFVLIKPDGVRRGLATEIMSRFERCGLKIVGMRFRIVNRDFASRHYTEEDITARHGERVREQLMEYLTSGPVLTAVLEGYAAVAVVRKICGTTEPTAALPGTIRGDYCHHGYKLCNESDQAVRNVIHASATPPEAQAEIVLWFNEDELITYRTNDEQEHFFR